MRGSGVRSGLPDAHEVFPASMNKQGHWPVGLIMYDAEILPLGIVPNLDGGIVPPVETMAHVASITQGDVLFENGGPRTQSQFNGPFHSINSVDIAHGD